MSEVSLQHVTIVGVGLLGGSAGLAIKQHWPDARIAGVGRRQSSLDEALACGAIDEAHLSPADPAARSDLVLLCTPVRAFGSMLETIRPVLKDSAWITDVGSTKADVVRQAGEILGEDARFVGSHPMAGSEKKGPSFASADLYAGATCVLTPCQYTPPEVTTTAKAFWETLGMRCLQLDPEEHDRAVARVSHLPHVLATLLTLLPRESELAVAATGFESMTRLAEGDPEMWRDILLTNVHPVCDALNDLSAALGTLRELIRSGNAEAIESLLERGQRRKRKFAEDGSAGE
jgi:prephenate dehydrogenase